MSQSKFKAIQEDVCYVEPEEQAPDKICPTCIPNPNYFPPDWTITEEPYFNEKVCEYQTKVVVNINGRIYHDPDLPIADFDSLTQLKNSPYEWNVLLKTYIRPGIRKILRHFNKLETDKIVCAAPPENEGEICEGIFGLDYEK